MPFRRAPSCATGPRKDDGVYPIRPTKTSRHTCSGASRACTFRTCSASCRAEAFGSTIATHCVSLRYTLVSLRNDPYSGCASAMTTRSSTDAPCHSAMAAASSMRQITIEAGACRSPAGSRSSTGRASSPDAPSRAEAWPDRRVRMRRVANQSPAGARDVRGLLARTKPFPRVQQARAQGLARQFRARWELRFEQRHQIFDHALEGRTRVGHLGGATMRRSSAMGRRAFDSSAEGIDRPRVLLGRSAR
jgi:hypothetical protein